jgi:hypothetical protein
MENEEFDKKWNSRYMEHVKKGEHIGSAPETRERLAILETTQKLFMEENKKEHRDLMNSQIVFHEEVKTTLADMMEKLDAALEKKAGIWVERVLYGAGAVAGIYGLNKLLGLIF